jgi:hypothetical protein
VFLYTRHSACHIGPNTLRSALVFNSIGLTDAGRALLLSSLSLNHNSAASGRRLKTWSAGTSTHVVAI